MENSHVYRGHIMIQPSMVLVNGDKLVNVF